jgi:hypothetical protein
MTVQKLLTYTPLDIKGQKLNSEHQLNLNVLENSGNYLVHKDILRHYTSQRQGTVSTKTRGEVRGGVVNLGNKKELGVQGLVQIVHHYGKVVVLFLVQNQKRLYLN